MRKIAPWFVILLLTILNITHGYNIIVNNTKFLFNIKNAKVDKQHTYKWENLNEDGRKHEFKLPDWSGDNCTLEQAKAFFENRLEDEPSDTRGDIITDFKNRFVDEDNQNGFLNDGNHNGNQGSGDGEDERIKLFNLAMELKEGSNNRKPNINKSISIFEKLILEKKKDKITSSSYYELGKIHFIGYKNIFFCYKRNLKLSIYYLEKASQMRNPGALHFLSFIYFFEFDKEVEKQGQGQAHNQRQTEGSKSDRGSSPDADVATEGGIFKDENNKKRKNMHMEERNTKRKEISKGKSDHFILHKQYKPSDPPTNNKKSMNPFLKSSIEYEFLACGLSYTPSVLSVAYKYLYGINLKANCEKSKNYYKMVADKVMNSDYINVPLSELDILNVENLNMHNEINNLKDNEEDILEFLNDQIKGGDVMALYDLGKKYKEERNFTKAYEYITEASKKNNVLAQKELGIIYLYGYGTQKNIKKSIENFTKAAAAGDVESKCYLGYIYYFMDEHRNVKLSIKYLVEAANHDYGEAFFFLAEIILDLSIKKHYISDAVYRIIFKLYEHAADLGYVQAYFREAQLYEIGKGVKQSCLNATLSYKFVAESTLWTNKIREGMNYYIQKDYIKAFYTYALAAYEGYEVAQSNLIYIYKNNKLENLISPEKIMQLLHLLYKQGNYKALYEIGMIYNKQNKENISISYHKLGLNKGDLRNLLPLSVYYEKNMNPDRALKYLNYFMKQKKRDKVSNNTKVDRIRNIFESSLLYFRKYKLLFKNFFRAKQKKGNI
ncbi:ubiquitin-protein ligase [Plasmodium gonderi]|uniref:Ubiquitin-protein ligase n=1 Tax=Plasmodium gonderi TaxID=77519 RepID=A0A1Y1JJP9_PLAGO|nr:ubiquitin-protein ligase [Plasmodium gonderi]GAW80693.1 ubiquitin-protein ligase [Plasmodium gonderi]